MAKDKFIKQLKGIFPHPATIPPESIKDPIKFGKGDLEALKKIGLTEEELKKTVLGSTQVNYERMSIYREVDRAIQHWMVGSAAELYADYSTCFNQLHNASIWITAESHEYQNNLNAFLETISMEEKVFDWAWTLAAYGDLFIGAEGVPGLGVVNINDNLHPANISRVDYKGCLVGFYQTPFEYGIGGMQAIGDAALISPWDYVHFRVLGAKKKRPLYGDPTMTEYRSVHLMGPEIKQVTSKYGTSLLINGLPIYKRLRLTEDSIMLARLTRGILKYVYKIRVDGMPDAAAAIIDSYQRILKRARALNTDPNNPSYDSKSNPMAVVEDLFIPVWGDAKNDVQIEKIGGEVDIRWLADMVEQRNQLAAALRCPLALMGAYIKESTGALGSDAIEKLDIRFARASRRLQRAMINGVTRLCQIHLSYQGMDADPALFEVHMSETSTAEEKELREALDLNLDVTQKFMDTVKGVGELMGKQFDYIELWEYINQKFLKLNDLDLASFIIEDIPMITPGTEGVEGGAAMPAAAGSPAVGEDEMTIADEGEPGATEGEMTVPPNAGRMPREGTVRTSKAKIREDVKRKIKEEDEAKRMKRRGSTGMSGDLTAALPYADNSNVSLYESKSTWDNDFKDTYVQIRDTRIPRKSSKKKKADKKEDKA